MAGCILGHVGISKRIEGTSKFLVVVPMSVGREFCQLQERHIVSW